MDHPCFPSPLKEEGLAPGATVTGVAPPSPTPAQVLFYSNQAAVMGLSPHLLPPTAAGRGSEPERTLTDGSGITVLLGAMC